MSTELILECKNIKWIFFDIGSTLVDESKAYEHRLKDAIAETDISYEQAYNKVVEIAKQNNAEPIKALGLPLTPWHSEYEIINPKAEDCLKLLHKKYKIGIIANQPPGTAERLKKYGIYEYIDLVISSAEENIAKPDLKIFKLALDRAKCSPQNAVMVGDRIDNDIVPAKALGMRTVWVRQGFGGLSTPQNEAETADLTIQNISEICKCFEL